MKTLSLDSQNNSLNLPSNPHVGDPHVGDVCRWEE